MSNVSCQVILFGEAKLKVEEARKTRARRASILTTNKERNEYEVMRTVLCKTGAFRARNDVRNTPTDVEQVSRQGRWRSGTAEFPAAA